MINHRINMKFNKSVKPSVEELYDTVLEKFPYELTRTGCTLGDIETLEDDYLEYSEEFTFEVGRIINEPVIAGGWIDIRQDSVDDDMYISGFFTIAFNGDFENSKILSDDKALQAHYDIDTQTWEFNIDVY